MKVICPKECKERIAQGEAIKIIDIRELYEYDQCNIGSTHIPMAEIIERQNELDENDQLKQQVITLMGMVESLTKQCARNHELLWHE